jgi:hypothetical protein
MQLIVSGVLSGCYPPGWTAGPRGTQPGTACIGADTALAGPGPPVIAATPTLPVIRASESAM